MDTSHAREEGKILAKMPIGYKFLPTDEELMAFYLKNKILSEPLPPSAIRDIDWNDLYRQPPANLVTSSYGHNREWFFFIRYDKNLHETTSTRIVGDRLGFWKKANKNEIPIPIEDNPNLRATKNFLTYFTGREDTKARKTNWEMEEYHLRFQFSIEGNPKTEVEWFLAKIKRGGHYKNLL